MQCFQCGHECIEKMIVINEYKDVVCSHKCHRDYLKAKAYFFDFNDNIHEDDGKWLDL